MKRYILFIYIVALSLVWGCSDWLDVESKTEISADELFDNERGFVVALNGIYSKLATNNMYGRELTYGAVEALGRGLATDGVMYTELMNYNYEYSSVKSFIASIWKESYNLIANCNEILDQVDKKGENFFTGNNYSLVKGQALAARAMLHFNIARFFAPHPSKSNPTILPYYEEVTHVGVPAIPTDEFLKKVLNDFSNAKALLAINDTLPDVKQEMQTIRFSYSMSNMEKYIGFRFNYYSVSALLARAALWCNDKELAYENALSIINAKYNNKALITFTTASNINKNKCDRLFSDDILFALYRQTDELAEAFNQTVAHYIANYNHVFDSEETDLRKKLTESLPGEQFRTYKYTATHFETNRNYLLPMIRLSEMYYIVAEVLADKDLIKATQQLDYVRKQRGVKTNFGVPGDKAGFIELLIKEVRGETLSEGQMFFYYKRLNHPVLDETNGDQTLDDEFTFPLPEAEFVG